MVNVRDPDAREFVIGICQKCGFDMTNLDNIYRDAEGNLFCSKECALEFYGVEPLSDNWEDYMEDEYFER